MSHKLRLGPIAVFLAVIAAVVATLAILTFATSRADAALAERFAAVTAVRYELEEDGNRFLQEAQRQGTGADLSEAGPDGETTDLGGGCWQYYIEKDGYALTVEVEPDSSGSAYAVTTWRISRLWVGDDPFEDLWLG